MVIDLTYKQGSAFAINLLSIVLILAGLNLLVSLCIGIRKKDAVVIFFTNIISKILLLVCFTFAVINESNILVIVGVALTIIIEALIYDSCLTYKKINKILLLLICNFGAGLLFVVMGYCHGYFTNLGELDSIETVGLALCCSLISVFFSIMVGIRKKDLRNCFFN